MCASEVRPHDLHQWALRGISLEQALDSLGRHLHEATALLYSPAWCRFGICEESVLRGRDGPLDVGAIFEARVFSPIGELRWWNDPQGADGRAVWLSEGDAEPADTRNVRWQRRTMTIAERRPNRYVLWGAPHESAGNWTRLAAQRIGVLDVPHRIDAGRRGVVETFEYLAVAPGDAGAVHGNVVIVEERLIRLDSIGVGA